VEQVGGIPTSSTKNAIKDKITSNLRAGTPHTSRGKYV